MCVGVICETVWFSVYDIFRFKWLICEIVLKNGEITGSRGNGTCCKGDTQMGFVVVAGKFYFLVDLSAKIKLLTDLAI